MDEFGYLSVFLSIILGLAVTQVLVGMRGRLLTRRRVCSFWPVQWWAAIILLICAQTWWAMFGLRNRHDWDFASFIILLAQVTVLYLVAGLVYPDFSEDREVDLRAHYFEQRRHLFTLFTLVLLTSICRDLILDHRLPDPWNLGFHLVFMGFALSGVLFAAEWYHKLSVVIVAGLFIIYIVTLFTRLH